MSGDVISLDERRRAREGGWALVLAFDTDDPEFCRGVEAGMLYEQMKHATGPWRGAYSEKNRTMIERVAAACGFGVAFEPSSADGWIEASFVPLAKVK